MLHVRHEDPTAEEYLQLLWWQAALYPICLSESLIPRGHGGLKSLNV